MLSSVLVIRAPARMVPDGPVEGDHERDVLLAEERLGHDRAGDVGRDRVDLVGVDAERELRAVAARVGLEHLAHDHAADLHVGAFGQLETDRGGLEGDLLVVGELLREHRVGQPDADQQQAHEHHAQRLVGGQDPTSHRRVTPPA
ncbi:hypothetical protein [Nocardioides sp. TF02-7]|uniref:hypothetical protein n=1 Tax=Nocardioides sp. TF02-7 TaxID=2917724 RepID=UPI001F06F50A|nr:hypothetical protein [Nocardioides sp. TF02-7]UMG93784.1 hypothetical protein MF408_06415 [Nocardioides sp. TF02-7]